MTTQAELNEFAIKVKIAKLEDENSKLKEKLKEDTTNLINKYNALVKKHTSLVREYNDLAKEHNKATKELAERPIVQVQQGMGLFDWLIVGTIFGG